MSALYLPVVEGQRVVSPCEKPASVSALRATISAVTRGPDRVSRTFEGVEPMGRGRAKAKQVKVARQLKYSGGGMDLDQLRAEFGVATDPHDAGDHDPYADFASRYSVDDDEDEDDDEDDLDDLDDEDDDLEDEDDFDDEDDLEDEDEDFDDEDELGEGFDGEAEADPAFPRAGGAGFGVSRANGS
jgi:hypothetical protein